jgi:hypothetical protein
LTKNDPALDSVLNLSELNVVDTDRVLDAINLL